MTKPEDYDPVSVRAALENLNAAAASVAANRETHLRLTQAYQLVRSYLDAAMANPTLKTVEKGK
jgi:hypothetical protein